MKHDFPRTFSLPEPHAGLGIFASTPLRPWEYVRLRREAAHLSISAAAVMLTGNARDLAPAMDLIRSLETPYRTARHDETLDRLASVFPFDPAVYRQLRDDPIDRHPRVCRCCGTSDWDLGAASLEWTSTHACTLCLDGKRFVGRAA